MFKYWYTGNITIKSISYHQYTENKSIIEFPTTKPLIELFAVPTTATTNHYKTIFIN